MNQNPEQVARDAIDQRLAAAGWIVQDRKKLNLAAGRGMAVREYPTDAGPADYVLFVDKHPAGIIEAKRQDEGFHLSSFEDQSNEYAVANLKYCDYQPLPFVYESTGTITRFTDHRDPKPRAREVFTFHRPETSQLWLNETKSLRGRMLDLPGLPTDGLRDCQVVAINNLEQSFKRYFPKALVQMVSGSGKTYTAITSIYRLLKYAKAKRILFLVDTKHLGEQAEQAFMAYLPSDDNRKFTELYAVTRLKSSYLPADHQVYIGTIQRMYLLLKGTELDESAELSNPNETGLPVSTPMPVVYC